MSTGSVEDLRTWDAVLDRARSGDHDACAALWRELAPGVTGYLRARGSQDPDDLTSETFLAFFRSLPDFEGGASQARALLFTIARRRLVDELRARRRRPTPASWSESADTRVSPSAETCALESLGSTAARQALDSLSADQREVLLLRIFGDLTVDQVAELLGRSVGGVKALQRRGLAGLRRRLDAHGATPHPPNATPRWEEAG